ncbi:hypothetical protein HU200_038707 [Digitaria exilis]|uniref:Uncharacterized protein n=1 Tax=Digitaria exilis TaxID=1010633 RepID=A0A835EIN5_9POAL|nr:hypothetical protein HU200_038707 [Digitaria exilis]
MAAPRLTLVGALLLVLALAVSGQGAAAAPRLRGSVACLDCTAGHDLSGVVVAVKCAGDDGLRAAQTDGRGAFDEAMPEVASPTLCAARVLGGTEQLCAPRGLAVAHVVPAGRTPDPSSSSSSYALGSRLAVFTRCHPATSGSAAATTMDAPDQQQQGDAPRVPAARRMPPAEQTPVVGAPPRAGGNAASPPFGMGSGLPLIYFFPFVPIIGIP